MEKKEAGVQEFKKVRVGERMPEARNDDVDYGFKNHDDGTNTDDDHHL
jgi:hypothetical protein